MGIKLSSDKIQGDSKDELNFVRLYLWTDSIFLNHPVFVWIRLLIITYLLNYSMKQSPSWKANRVLQLVKKFPAFYGTPKFITVLTSARNLSLSWANSIQSPQPLPTSWRSILILSSYLCLGLPNGLLPSGFPTKILCAPLLSSIIVRLSHSSKVRICISHR